MLALALIKGSNLWTGLRSMLFSAFGISFYLLTVQTIVIGVRMATVSACVSVASECGKGSAESDCGVRKGASDRLALPAHYRNGG